MILLITGCPCSGKSVVCRELENYGFESVDVDRFFDYGKCKYDQEHSVKAYRKMFDSLGDGDYAIETPGNAPAFFAQRKKLVHYTTVRLDASWETILHRYNSRWQANDIPPWKLKEEYSNAERLKADVIVNTENMGPSDVARVIMQRVGRHQHGAAAIHKEMFSENYGSHRRDFLDDLLD